MTFKSVIERLRTLGVPDAAIPGVMEYIDEREAEAVRPRTGTERSRSWREKRRNENETKSLPERVDTVAPSLQNRCAAVAPPLPVVQPDDAPLYWKSLDITLEASASKGADAPSEEPEANLPVDEKPITPDAKLYERAREIAGPKAAQFVTLLKRQNGGDIGDTRQMVEQAALADDPLKYLIGIVARGKRKADFSQGRPPPRDAPLSPRTQALAEIYHEQPDRNDEPEWEASGAHAPGDRGRVIGWPGRFG